MTNDEIMRFPEQVSAWINRTNKHELGIPTRPTACLKPPWQHILDAREEAPHTRPDLPSLGPKYASSEARAAWWASQGVEAQKDARHGLAEGLETKA